MTLPIPNPTGNVSTQKVKSSWVNNLSANAYVAPYGLMFFDTYDGVLRLGDNVTPGGQIINTGGNGGGNTNYTDSNVIALLESGTLTSNIITTGNVSGTYFIGNGAFLTGITGSGNYGNANVELLLETGISNNIVTTGNVYAGNIEVTGNITAGNIGNAATYLWGDGSNITGVVGVPALPLNSIQFNNANAFTGSANLTFDVTTGVLSLTGVANVTGNINATGDIVTTANVYGNTVIDNFGIFLNGNVIASDFTIPAGFNGGSFGPMQLGNSVVTVPDGQRWTIV